MATKADLQAAIDLANADRSEEDQIKPEGSTKADLEAALTAAGVDLPAEDEKKSSDVVVTAPLVVVRTKDGADVQMRHGDVIGDNVTKESLEHLRSLGFVSDSE